MRIRDILDSQGRPIAFEVSTAFLDRRAVRQIVQAIPGARILAYRPYREQLCEFVVSGAAFLVYEAWGESAVYWVGPKQAGWCAQLASVRDAFARARPFLWFVTFRTA